MESKNLLTLAITLTVGIILAGSLLMPVISDATETERTFTNEGLYRMSAYDDAATISASWDHTKPNEITVNDVVIALPSALQTIDMTLFGCDDFLIRYNGGTNPYIQLYGADYSGQITANVTNGTDMTITIAAGSATVTNGTNTANLTYTGTLFAPDKDGAYVMKPYNQDAYVKGDAEIYATGRTYIFSTNFTTVLDGDINDGIAREFWPESSVSTWTFGDLTTNAAAVDGFKNLYKLTSFTWTVSDGTNSGDMTYSQVIVPYETTAELSTHLNPGEIAILNALPVLIIVALVVMAAGALYLKRDD